MVGGVVSTGGGAPVFDAPGVPVSPLSAQSALESVSVREILSIDV